MKKKLLSLLLVGAMALSLGACGSESTETASAGETQVSDEAANSSSSDEKQDLVVMITNPGDVNNAVEQMLIDKLGDKYNIITKTWDSASVEQTVKTAAAANEQIDLVQYWPNQMNSFTSVGLATDLTEYMDDTWASTFNDGVLDIGTYDAKLYNVAYKTVYPAMLVDLEVTRAAGIDDSEIKEQMTWDEFLDICRRIESNSDAYGACIQEDYACWLSRNAMMQAWSTDAELDVWNNGDVSFTDPKIVAACDQVKAAFDEGLFYPGDGALAVTQDQTYGAVTAHKVGFLLCPTTTVKTTIDNTGITDYMVCDYPAMGSNPTNPLLGGCDGYFIPTSSKNVEGAVEAMKYLTSEEVATFRAEGGQVPTMKVSESADIDTVFMESISRCSDQIYPTEIINIDPELSDYLQNSMPANYIYNGASALEELETLRVNAKGE